MKTSLFISLALVMSSAPIFAQQTLGRQTVKPKMKSQFETKTAVEAFKLNARKPIPSEKFDRSQSFDKAQGGADPGGGGAYKIKGELKTLAEAGVIFERISNLGSKDYPRYYKVSDETKLALQEISEKVTGNSKLGSKSIGNRDTFIDQTDNEKSKYEMIKKDYSRVIRSYGKTLDESAFILTAYTEENKTYILPSFQDLKPNQQALVLIHEYFMRSARYSKGAEKLARILNMDAVIFNILENGENEGSSLRYYQALEKLDGISPKDVIIMRIARLEKLVGRPLLFSEFTIDGGNNTFDPSLVQNFESYIPGIADALNGYGIAKQYITARELNYVMYSEFYELAKVATQLMGGFIIYGYDTYAASKRRAMETFNKPKFDSICENFSSLLEKSEVKTDSFLSQGFEQKLYSFTCGVDLKTGAPIAEDLRAVEIGKISK